MEEIRSANEELQSTHEELQSINEEAISAKEELQSLNEELMTVNLELREKTDQLSELNNDMTNLLNSSEIATVFLNNNLQVKRFTLASTQVFHLIPSDLGRSLAHIRSNLRYETIEQDAREVIDRLTPKEVEVQSFDGRYYIMRILPYRTLNNFIDGAVLTFVEVTSLKELQDKQEASRTFAESIINSMRDPLVVLNQELRVVALSRAFTETFKMEDRQTEGKLIYEIGNGQWDIPQLRQLLEDITQHESELPPTMDDFIVEHNFPRVGFKQMKLYARHLINKHGHNQDHLILLIMEDITH